MEASGYHGLILGAWLRRCKIGLFRNPEARLDRFHRNQPPCDVRILKAIYVEDMPEIESQLHEKFRNCNVDLIKSQEWFDFNSLQFLSVQWEFEKRRLYMFSISELPIKLIIFSMIGLLSVGAMPTAVNYAGRLTNQPVNSVIQPQEKLTNFAKSKDR